MADNDVMVLPDPDDWPAREADREQPPPGHVDSTTRLSDGTVLRVFVVGDRVRLTIAGADGMATADMAPGDVILLDRVLDAAETDARKARGNGTPW